MPVLPILKGRQLDASLSSNYKPISQSTVCARVLEKVILEKYNDRMAVSDSQVGFKTGGSSDIVLSLPPFCLILQRHRAAMMRMRNRVVPDIAV
ncbi:hypothetical protein K1T71_014626 [Dendrolimus kikuchii]|uniref:Uncharacterized protein n=1 Tax=Dendrolimus kikuchii TaxID=765133 RepID=A0ACC1CEU6_9NEOP|nr:hypothetical protein K1T71_014626 [Dendrolimus kikuchii]